jgi:hypothetical protein
MIDWAELKRVVLYLRRSLRTFVPTVQVDGVHGMICARPAYASNPFSHDGPSLSSPRFNRLRELQYPGRGNFGSLQDSER